MAAAMEAWVAAAATRDVANAIVGADNAVEIARENAAAHGHTAVVWAIDALAVDVPKPIAMARRAFERRVTAAECAAAAAADEAPSVARGGLYYGGKTWPMAAPRAALAYWHLCHPEWGCRRGLAGATAFQAVEAAVSEEWVRRRAAELGTMARKLLRK